MDKAVSIVIPTWNGLELLKRYLPSVVAAAVHYSEDEAAPTEILFVDDGSSDATIEWLIDQGFEEKTEGSGLTISDREVEERVQLLNLQNEKLPGSRGWEAGDIASSPVNSEGGSSDESGSLDAADTRLRYLRNDTNLGFGESCNRGIRAASFPLVLLLNNDVRIAPGAIAPLVRNFGDEKVFAAHCRVFELESGRECGTGKLGGFARGFIRVHRSYAVNRQAVSENPGSMVEEPGSHGPPGYRAPLFSMFAGGGAAMFDREMFIALGGFDPLLSPFYWEDVELSYRAWKRGFDVLYEPHSVVDHRVSSTIGRLPQWRVRRIQQRNRIIYHWIHLHDGGLLMSHLAWTVALALTAPIRLKPGFLLSVISALGKLPRILQRRRQEKRLARRSDRDVLDLFAALETRDDIFPYEDFTELTRINAKIGAQPGNRGAPQ